MNSANLILRLDDGQIIGRSQVLSKQLNIPEGQVVKLTVPELFRLERVGDRESLRTQNILNELNSRQLENLNNIRTSKKSSKKQKPDQDMVQQPSNQKKQKQQSQKPSKQQQSNDQLQKNFTQINGQAANIDDPEYQSMAQSFNQIISKVLGSLGKYREIFEQPVDRNQIPQYYEKIKNPMDLQTMKQKLELGLYTTPQQFRDTPETLPITLVLFEQTFHPPLSMNNYQHDFQVQGQRSKRLTAGQHSQRFEDKDFDDLNIQTPAPVKQKSLKEKPSKSKSQKIENDISKGKQNQATPQQPQVYQQQQQSMPVGMPNQVAQSQQDKQQQIKMFNEQLMILNQQFQQLKGITDHPNPQLQQQQLMDINKQMQKVQWQLEKEYILAQRGYMEPGLKNYIATVINDGNVGDDVMEGALGVIQAGVSVESGDEGLVEVEIDNIDDATLWKLHDFLRSQGVLGPNANMQTQIPPQQNPQNQQLNQHMPDQMQQ